MAIGQMSSLLATRHDIGHCQEEVPRGVVGATSPTHVQQRCQHASGRRRFRLSDKDAGKGHRWVQFGLLILCALYEDHSSAETKKKQTCEPAWRPTGKRKDPGAVVRCRRTLIFETYTLVFVVGHFLVTLTCTIHKIV